jgi:hypothetical protein
MLAKNGKKVFIAQVVTATVVLNVEDIAQAIKEDGYELNIATIIDVFDRIVEKVKQAIVNGNSVDLDIVKVTPLVDGPWEDHDSYEEGVHSKTVTVTPKAALTKELQDVQVDVVAYRKPGDTAVILGVTDKATRKKDYSITVGDNIIIKGEKIKLQGLPDPDNDDDNDNDDDDDDDKNLVISEEGIGVFFVPETGTPIQATRVDANTATKVEVRVPTTLQKGKQYGLQINTRYAGTIPLNVPRTIVADFLLTTVDDNKIKQAKTKN